MKRKWLSMILSVCLALNLLPVTALADNAAAKTAGTISILENPTKVYDGKAVAAPSVQTNSGGAVSYTYYDALGAALSDAPANAGSYSVTATVAATANFAAATTNKYAFTIAKRPVDLGLSTSYSGDGLTVTAAVLGAVDNAGTINFTFTLQGNTISTVSGQIKENSGFYTAAATLSVGDGTYAVTASYVSGTSDNYTCTSTPSINFDRVKYTRSINCDSVLSKTYGTVSSFDLNAAASEKAQEGTDTFSYEVLNDSYVAYGLGSTVSVDSSNGAVTINNAGTAFIKIKLTDSKSIYNEADAYVKVQVDPAPLTVTSQVKNGDTVANQTAYGTAGSLTCSLSYSKFVNSDAADTFTGGHGTLAVLPLSNVLNAGEHTVEIARQGGSTSLSINNTEYSNIFLCRNYALTYEKASLTVTKATPTVSTLDQTVTIGWGLSRLTVPASAAGVNGETVPGTFTWSESSSGAALDSSFAFSGSAGDKKTLYWTFTPTDGTNYAAATGGAVFTLRDKTSVTLDGLSAPADRVYTGSAIQGTEFGTPTDYTGTLTYTYYSGSTVSGTPLTAAPTKAGDYTVRVSVPESDSDYTGQKDIPFSIQKCTSVLSDITFDPESAHQYGSHTTASATLKGKNGSPLVGLRATLTYKNDSFNESYYMTSDSNGLLSQTTDILLPVGTYTVTLSFDGNDNCLAVTKTASYTVAAVSSGSSAGGSTSATTNTDSSTVTNTDGSKTTTDTTVKTDSSGATTTDTVATTTNTDGTTTKVVTETTKKTDAATGAVTETTTQKTTNAAGKTEVVEQAKTVVTDKTTGAKTETVAETKTTADGTTTKVETVKVAGGTDGITAEAKVETGKTGEAVATALIEAPATATTTTLPAAVVEAVTKADTAEVTVKVGEVSVALDKEAVEAVKATGGEAPTLSATPVAAKDLPSDLQSATKAYDFKVSGKGVNFGGGSAVVSVPYTKTDSSKAVAVYHIDAAGNKTRVYDVTLTADRLNIPTTGWSTYAVLEVAPLPFTDVSDTDWFYGSVQYAVDNNLFKGTSATTFSPNVTMTRGMLVTVLWRMAGSPAMDDYGYPYGDVNAKTNEFAPAIYWARDQKLVNGYSDDKFGPDDAVTREQMVSILYRYATLKGYDTTQGGMAIREYSDYASISSYAATAMDWAVNAGLLNGSDGKLNPASGATRAEVAAILMRFGQKLAK